MMRFPENQRGGRVGNRPENKAPHTVEESKLSHEKKTTIGIIIPGYNCSRTLLYILNNQGFVHWSIGIVVSLTI